MASALSRIPFAEELSLKVQAFHCGGERWEREVSDWIKAPRGVGGALDELDRGRQIWLYVDGAGELVGFGSLGEAMQRWPRAKDPQIRVNVIPMLGVDQRFWGQPPGPSEERYSARILDDLIEEARAHRESRPILILFVAIENLRAVRYYERAGFAELHKPYTDKQTGRQHKRMVLALNDSPG